MSGQSIEYTNISLSLLSENIIRDDFEQTKFSNFLNIVNSVIEYLDPNHEIYGLNDKEKLIGCLKSIDFINVSQVKLCFQICLGVTSKLWDLTGEAFIKYINSALNNVLKADLNQSIFHDNNTLNQNDNYLYKLAMPEYFEEQKKRKEIFIHNLNKTVSNGLGSLDINRNSHRKNKKRGAPWSKIPAHIKYAIEREPHEIIKDLIEMYSNFTKDKTKTLKKSLYEKFCKDKMKKADNDIENKDFNKNSEQNIQIPLQFLKNMGRFQKDKQLMLNPVDKFQLYLKSIDYIMTLKQDFEKKEITSQKIHENIERILQFHKINEQVIDFLSSESRIFNDEIEKKINNTLSKNESLENKNNFEKEIKDTTEIAREMGRVIATKEASRFHRKSHGRVNFKKLFRSTLKYFNIPIELEFKAKRITKPKLVIICDVSGSMINYIPFFLSFFYEFNQIYSHISTYLFVDKPVEVTRFFSNSKCDIKQTFNEIINLPAINRMGYSAIGDTFNIFTEKYLPEIDSRTVVIVASDARNNWKTEALDNFYLISSKARKLIWLNPEDRGKWNTGDSIISHYEPCCDYLYRVSTPEELNLILNANPFDVSPMAYRTINRSNATQLIKYRTPRYHHYSYNNYDRYSNYNYYGYKKKWY